MTRLLLELLVEAAGMVAVPTPRAAVANYFLNRVEEGDCVVRTEVHIVGEGKGKRRRKERGKEGGEGKRERKREREDRGKEGKEEKGERKREREREREGGRGIDTYLW